MKKMLVAPKLPNRVTWGISFNQPKPKQKPGAFVPSTLSPAVNQQVDSALDYFTKKISEETNDLWVQQLIPHLQGYSVLQKTLVQKIQEEGIPMTFRGQVWMFLVKDDYHMNAHIYESHKTQRGTIDQMIDLDIPRTFPELNPLFAEVHSI